MNAKLELIKQALLKIAAILNLMKSNREILYDTAASFIGRDASPNDVAPDELGCAESVQDVHKAAFGSYLGANIVSTASLYQTLCARHDFAKVLNPLPGDIIISPTGMGGKNGVLNGHTGIIAKYGILSNDSRTGTWEENYTLDAWRRYYGVKGGYPLFYFRKL